MSKQDRIKALLRFYGENATVHGIAAIHNNLSILRKIIFAFLFTSLLGAVIYAVYFSFYSFSLRQVYTSVEKESHRNIEFPSVTICRNGKATKSSLPVDIVDRIMAKLEGIKDGNASLSALNKFVQNASLEVRAAFQNSNMSIPEHPPMLLRHIKDACLFASNKYCNVTRDFKSTYGTDACYTFHGPGPNTYFQAENGPLFGLQLILYVNESDYLPLIETRKGAGFTIFVHERGTIPLLEIGGILVAPGTFTQISIYKSETISLPYPFRTNCSDGEGLTNYFPGRYSDQSCLVTCFYKHVFEKCGYVDPTIGWKIKPKKKSMVTIDMLKCELEMRNQFLEGDSLAHCDCPKACKEVIYDSKTSSSKWPVDGDLPLYIHLAKSILGFDPKNASDDFSSKNFLKVRIYFDELSVMRYVTKELIGELDLISNIGGHLGFWCGASVFSVFEAIALIASIIFMAIFGKSGIKVNNDKDLDMETFQKSVIKVKSDKDLEKVA